ncbi:unnamed protein product [Closterium sp. NIES-54]
MGSPELQALQREVSSESVVLPHFHFHCLPPAFQGSGGGGEGAGGRGGERRGAGGGESGGVSRREEVKGSGEGRAAGEEKAEEEEQGEGEEQSRQVYLVCGDASLGVVVERQLPGLTLSHIRAICLAALARPHLPHAQLLHAIAQAWGLALSPLDLRTILAQTTRLGGVAGRACTAAGTGRATVARQAAGTRGMQGV